MAAPHTPLERKNGHGEAAKPFSIRLTEDEKRLLVERADNLPLSTYVRDLIVDDTRCVARRRATSPVKDQEALARILAALRQSRIASNLNQLAKAANIGALPVTPETEQEISNVCAAVLAMRADLMRALGLMEGSGP